MLGRLEDMYAIPHTVEETHLERKKCKKCKSVKSLMSISMIDNRCGVFLNSANNVKGKKSLKVLD